MKFSGIQQALEANPWIAWIVFIAMIFFFLFVDLKIAHRRDKEISVKESLVWTGIWVSLGLLFGIVIGLIFGMERALEYYSGFILEKSLSVDNIFVFVMIFAFFKVEPRFQHRVLFYGVVGAIVLRAAAILSGSYLLSHFHWMIYVFGAILVVTAIKMLWLHNNNSADGENRFLRLLGRVLPVTHTQQDAHFFIKENNKWMLTPLAISLVAVEISDVIFALDSIPAIFAITRDPFVVFSSNIFAILGLRSLFFLSSHLVRRFHYLTHGVAIVLIFVGVKMMLVDVYKIPILASLLVIVSILGVSVAYSSLLEWRRTRVC